MFELHLWEPSPLTVSKMNKHIAQPLTGSHVPSTLSQVNNASYKKELRTELADARKAAEARVAADKARAPAEKQNRAQHERTGSKSKLPNGKGKRTVQGRRENQGNQRKGNASHTRQWSPSGNQSSRQQLAAGPHKYLPGTSGDATFPSPLLHTPWFIAPMASIPVRQP